MKSLYKQLLGYGLGGALALSGAYLIAPHEGMENKAYVDPVGILTICYGETKNVKFGDYKTDDECLEAFAEDLVAHNKILMSVVKVDMTIYQHAAFLSFLYNVGPGKKGVKDGFVHLKKTGKPSTMLRKLNDGDYEGACNEFNNWMQKGQGLPGIEKRRKQEMALCKGELEYEINTKQKEGS